MEIVLISDPDSKRSSYFQKAAKAQGAECICLSWKEMEPSMLAGKIVKLDPPVFDTDEFQKMDSELQRYQEKLKEIEQVPCRFLNEPAGIAALLDKRECKKRLIKAGISVTEMLPEKIQNFQELKEAMIEQNWHQVFIKPIHGSGAAGITAFRMMGKGQKMAAYTSCRRKDGQLINYKKLFRMDRPKEIEALIDQILLEDCIVERWYPKEQYQGKSYDLRVVCQFDRVEFMVGRVSSGPITNLHLNNGAVEIEKLGLSEEKFREIESLCKKAMEQFPEIRVAGIDVLIEAGTKKPCIIEMNGQGDYIYQDLFGENKIYQRQVQWMKEQE